MMQNEKKSSENPWYNKVFRLLLKIVTAKLGGIVFFEKIAYNKDNKKNKK